MILICDIFIFSSFTSFFYLNNDNKLFSYSSIHHHHCSKYVCNFLRFCFLVCFLFVARGASTWRALARILQKELLLAHNCFLVFFLSFHCKWWWEEEESLCSLTRRGFVAFLYVFFLFSWSSWFQGAELS